MGPRCDSLTREGNFITYNFFISFVENARWRTHKKTRFSHPKVINITNYKEKTKYDNFISRKFDVLVKILPKSINVLFNSFSFYNEVRLFISLSVLFYGMGIKLNCYLTFIPPILSSPSVSSLLSFGEYEVGWKKTSYYKYAKLCRNEIKRAISDICPWAAGQQRDQFLRNRNPNCYENIFL